MTKPSNVAKRHEFGHGDVEKGFAKADIVIERKFEVAAAHQGYIEPHACLASVGSDGQGELWVCTQGHYMVRNVCAQLLGMDVSKLRVTASEIGGGFGGKTTVFLEPVALLLSRKSGRPVKMVMSREDVFRASGPTSSAAVWVKVGCTKAGRITAAECELKLQGGAFPGSPVDMAAMAAFACYDLENVKAVGWDVVVNRPKQAAYRAPGAPISAFGVESVIDELAHKLGMDPLEFRLKNAAKEGTKFSDGPQYADLGLIATLEAVKNHPHYKAKLGPNQGRGIAAGFWFNFGGQTCVSLNINIDGTVALALGTPDIGGSRASMSQMAAEELGILLPQGAGGHCRYQLARLQRHHRGQPGHLLQRACHHPGGARRHRQALRPGRPDLGHSGGSGRLGKGPCQAVRRQCRQFRASVAGRHRKDRGQYRWADRRPFRGQCRRGGGELLHPYRRCGSGYGDWSYPGHALYRRAGRGKGHPSKLCRRPNAGWSGAGDWLGLNEEYVYNAKGTMANASFLDYRMPTALDLPMIDTVIVEVPNPGHPYGVRGVGEVPIVPPPAAVPMRSRPRPASGCWSCPCRRPRS